MRRSAVMSVLAFGVFAAVSTADDPGTLVLDETGYLSTYVQFGLDRLDPAALKAEAAKLLKPAELARLEKRVKKFGGPEFAPKGQETDWSKVDWRDRALVWFQTTQWGSGERAAFFSYSPPAAAEWANSDFSDRWDRNRLGLLVGNIRRERRAWGDHDMQQLEVRAAHFRTTFEVTDPSAEYTVNVVYRGGARVLVNGTEIVRKHLPAGDLGGEARAEPYPYEAYVRLPDEAPAGASAAVTQRFGVDFCADLIGRFEDPGAAGDAATQKDPNGPFWNIGIGWGTQTINRKGWDRVTALRNRTTGPVKIPAKLLKKGANVLAVEVRAADLYPVVVAGRDNNWGRSYFLHAQFTWAHCRLLEMQLRSSAANAASAMRRPAGVQVWVEDMHRRVYDADFGPPANPPLPGGASEVRFVGAPNGTFCGQIAVGTDKELKGLSATMGELKGDSGAVIAALAVKVGYLRAHPLTSMVKLGRVHCYPEQVDDPLKCSEAELGVLRYASPGGRTLPPEQTLKAMERLRYFDHIAAEPPPAVPADSAQPIWLTLNVPGDTPPGTYRGAVAVRAEGMKEVSIPVVAEVLGWRVPDPKDFQTVVALDQSPPAVASQYGVKPWSDEHFKLIETSVAQLGRVGNTWLVVPVLANTEFGNGDESMIRWAFKSDGSIGLDYTILDRYVGLFIKHCGRPRVICFVVMHGAGREGGAADGRVVALDEKTGQPVRLDVSSTGPKVREYCKVLATGLREHMRKLDLESAMHWGFGWDTWGDAPMIPLLREFAPNVRWCQTSHPGSASKDVPVVFCVTSGELTEQCNMGWRNTLLTLLNPRSGNNIHSSNGSSPPFTFRLMADRAIVAGKAGIGRIGTDYWKDTYFRDSKNFVSGGAAGMPCLTLLWPGPAGAEPSTRFEALREGVQETEARIFIEQALVRGMLPEPLAEKARRVTFEHNRETLYISAGRVGAQIHEYTHGWQDRSRRLFATAAEVAKELGFEVDRAAIAAEVPARGKATVEVKLRSFSAEAREWKAQCDAAWIVPAETGGTTRGQQTLKITLDASSLEAEKTVTGKLNVTDVVSGRAYPVAITAEVGKVMEFRVPAAFDFTAKENYCTPRPIAPRAVFNVPVGGSESRELALFNHSGRELDWKIESPVKWIAASPAAGKAAPGAGVIVKLTVAPPDRSAAEYETTLKVSEAGGVAEEALVVTHVIPPYAAPKLPAGEFVYLEDLQAASHKGVAGDAGGPLFADRVATREHEVPPHAMDAIVVSETVYDVAALGLTAFSAEVRVHPEHAKDDRFGMDKLKVCFEVHADGKVAATSGLMTAADQPRALLADLAGVKQMKLVTRFDASEGRNDVRTWIRFYCHGLWGEPKLYGPAAALAKLRVPGPFITEVLALGAFAGRKAEHPPEKEKGTGSFSSSEKVPVPLSSSSYQVVTGHAKWTVYKSPTPNIDLYKAAGDITPPDDAAVYLLAFAHATEDVELELETWYRHGMKVFVNGRAALDSDRVDTWTTMFDRAPIKLKKGLNPILLKVGCYPWSWYSAFRLRGTRADLAKVTVSMAEKR